MTSFNHPLISLYCTCIIDSTCPILSRTPLNCTYLPTPIFHEHLLPQIATTQIKSANLQDIQALSDIVVPLIELGCQILGNLKRQRKNIIVYSDNNYPNNKSSCINFRSFYQSSRCCSCCCCSCQNNRTVVTPQRDLY